MADKIDIKRAGLSLKSGLSWFKTSMIGVKLVVIALIVFTVYRAWFMEKNRQDTSINVEEGGTLNLKQTQGSNEKFQVFGEAYVFCESPSRYGVGLRTGIKF